MKLTAWGDGATRVENRRPVTWSTLSRRETWEVVESLVVSNAGRGPKEQCLYSNSRLRHPEQNPQETISQEESNEDIHGYPKIESHQQV